MKIAGDFLCVCKEVTRNEIHFVFCLVLVGALSLLISAVAIQGSSGYSLSSYLFPAADKLNEAGFQEVGTLERR